MYTGLLANEPILMPFQSKPFNADIFVAEEFLNLKEKFSITTIVEGGTCVGGSAKWFGENFERVHTIEIVDAYQDFAKQRCNLLTNISFHLGSTIYLLDKVLQKCQHDTIIFLDSHWAEHFPIFDELKLIKKSELLPVIVIHDFKVPNDPFLGFDLYNEVELSFENIKPYLDDIYGPEGYDYHYNTADTSTEVKRGVIYIYPRVK